MIGRLSVHPDGYGFLLPEDANMTDVFVPAHARNGALHGDRVRIMVQAARRRRRAKRGEKPAAATQEGVVVEIIARKLTRVVGRYLCWGKQRIVAPDDERIDQYIHIAIGDEGEATDGQSVVAELHPASGDLANAKLSGNVVHILGQRGEVATEIEAVLHSYDLHAEFSEEVMAEATERVDACANDWEGRTDLSHLPFVTIDGADAQDYDDAVTAEPITGDRMRISIAVADVDHFVQTGSALDQEAWLRATSVYFPRRVVPMLPEILSNQYCSLRPDEPRHALVAEYTVDVQGQVSEPALHIAKIQSRARLTYTQVHQVLDEARSEENPASAHVPMLQNLAQAARWLREQRMRAGCIDLDLPEAHVVLDEAGEPAAIRRAPRFFAHQIIEELMIAANEVVGRELMNASLPCLYRVHPEPALDGLQNLRGLLSALQIPDRLRPPLHSSMFAEIVTKVDDHPAARAVHHAILRSMQQAAYDTNNTGHFGLASSCYTHFTSPIRRYPDLVNHRLVKAHLRKKELPLRELDEYQRTARHCSQQERRAMEAEREVSRIYASAFLHRVVGEEFDGIVSHLTKHGCFVELTEHMVEGFVDRRSFPDDRYRFDREQGALVGKHTRNVIRVGDPLRIRVDKADVEAKQVEFSVVYS